ncbi:ABC transporter ATP-binding protein [Planosporangium sp. 12N6]|uniref:ABC transporter ATP-binding protein n=1 Tax=Planosporangium spinosum TaxID=3402278 RepID=UPI003CF291EE
MSTTATTATGSQAEPILSVRGVTKSFGGLEVLRGVDLDVARGSITALIGPNGSGKSTLFDIITRYQRCDAGEIVFSGESVQGLAPHQVSRRGLIRTFQLTRIFPTLTVAENLLVFAPRGRGAADGRDRAAELLEFVGLRRLADQEAAGLSYGQQKLLEIAQVLMLGPTLLMLDEPMAGVNPGLADEIVARLRELRDRGMTLLLVEHNMPVVMSMCDTVTVLNGGRAMLTGTPDEVLSDPEVREAFLGD